MSSSRALGVRACTCASSCSRPRCGRWPSADTFLIAATRMGGRHGYDEHGATSVMGGAVSGFCKAVALERGDTLVKVVDFERSRKTAALAELLIEETLRDPGAVEIGHSDGLRWTVGLVECEVEPASSSRLPSGGTYVVTGAAGSIVAAITADLAAHAARRHLPPA